MTRDRGTNRTKGKLIVFSLMAAAVVLVAVLSPVIAPFDPYAQNLGNALLAPSTEHLAGTDRYGRDLFSRVLVGAQSSIFSTFVLVAAVAVIGTLVGMLAGWCGGKLDTVLM